MGVRRSLGVMPDYLTDGRLMKVSFMVLKKAPDIVRRRRPLAKSLGNGTRSRPRLNKDEGLFRSACCECRAQEA